MPTARDLTPEEVAGYRAAARRQQQVEMEALALRERRAWDLARLAAAMLREQLGVQRVAVFGSLVQPGCFTEWSDVDIAAWGIDPQDTLRAIGLAMDLGTDIPVNLVDVGACSASLRRAIERDSVPL